MPIPDVHLITHENTTELKLVQRRTSHPQNHHCLSVYVICAG